MMHSKVLPATSRPIRRVLVSSLLAAWFAGSGAVSAQGLRLPGGDTSGSLTQGGPTVITPRAAPAPAPAPARAPSAPPVSGSQVGDFIVAVVNSEAITRRELDVRIAAANSTLASQQIAPPDPATLERQVLERMIVDRTQLQEAASSGIRVDDFQLDRAISRIAEQNKVSVAEMRSQIEREGLAFPAYREDLRQEIVLVRLRERAVDSQIQISESEIDNFLADQTETAPAELTLAQILVRVPEGSSSAVVSQLRAKAENLQAQARGPVDFARLAAAASDGEEALRGGDLGTRPANRWPGVFVDAVANLKPGQVANIVQSGNGFHIIKLVDRKASASAAESVPIQQTQARHILIRTSEIMSADLARQRLAEIRRRILAGSVTFAEMARQYSNDASAPQGGDLGWLSPSETVPEFERAMDALQVNDISEPVQSQFGVHLIQVIGRRTQDVGRERQRAAARQTLFQRKVDQQYEDWARQLRDRAYVEIRLGAADAPLN